MAASVGLASADIHAELLPQDKLELVRIYPVPSQSRNPVFKDPHPIVLVYYRVYRKVIICVPPRLVDTLMSIIILFRS